MRYLRWNVQSHEMITLVGILAVGKLPTYQFASANHNSGNVLQASRMKYADTGLC